MVMKKRRSYGRHRRPAPWCSRAAPFCPPEPAIVAGRFKGQKLSELSNENLNSFLRLDARSQTSVAFPSILTSQPITCRDLSQYRFAKYELERRKGLPEREQTTSVELTAEDTDDSIAQRLLNYGYRAASRKYHPDQGGDRSMQRLTAARDYARARLRP